MKLRKMAYVILIYYRDRNLDETAQKWHLMLWDWRMRIMYLYRYRPTENVLVKYNELKKQEIYFSSTSELNDPFEGAIVPFYKGTETHWLVLMQCMYQNVALECLSKWYPDYCAPMNIILSWQEEIVEYSSIKKIIRDLANTDTHFTHEQIKWLIQYTVLPYMYYSFVNQWSSLLNNNAIGGNEKQYIMAKKLIDDISQQDVKMLIRPFDKLDAKECTIIDKLKEKIRRDWNNFCYELGGSEGNGLENIIVSAMELLRKFADGWRQHFRIASFSKKCDIASMWGMYAKAQNGVCLKFEFDNIDDGHVLNFANDRIKDVYIHDVKYGESLCSFELAYNIFGFMDSCVNGKQNTSEYIKECMEPYLWKLGSWMYEEETRLLIPDFGKEYAKLRYNFAALKGIVWGANVSFNDRCDMVRIIREQCIWNKIKTFDFYEYDISNPMWQDCPTYRLEL